MADPSTRLNAGHACIREARLPFYRTVQQAKRARCKPHSYQYQKSSHGKMATQHDDNDLNTVNPWAATPPLEAGPATVNEDADDHHDHDHEERDAWRRRSSTATTTGSSDEGGGDNTLIEPLSASLSSSPKQDDSRAVLPQVTMDFDDFDPFRPDKTTTSTTLATTPTTANSAEPPIKHGDSDSQAQSSALVYSDTTPPPTPSKKERNATPASPSATKKTTDERPVDSSGVGKSAPHYTSTNLFTRNNEASSSSASEPSSSSSSLTTAQPQVASSSTNTTSSPSTTSPSTTSSSNMNKALSSSSTGNVLSNPLATIASAFRKRDFSNSNSNTPSRSNTPMPQSSSSASNTQVTAVGSNQGTPQSQSSPGSKSTNPPTGKPAPVILIRDNDDHILGEEFPNSGMNNDLSSSTTSSNSKVKGNTSAAAKAAAQIVQQAAGTESAGIIGDETSSHHSTNDAGQEGQSGGSSVIQPAFDFNFFLDQMRNKSAEPIAKYLRSFLREFSKKMWNVNDQIRVINDFLDVSFQAFPPCPILTIFSLHYPCVEFFSREDQHVNWRTVLRDLSIKWRNTHDSHGSFSAQADLAFSFLHSRSHWIHL